MYCSRYLMGLEFHADYISPAVPAPSKDTIVIHSPLCRQHLDSKDLVTDRAENCLTNAALFVITFHAQTNHRMRAALMPGANLELSLVELGPSIICQRGGVGLSGFTLKIGRVYNTPRHKYDTKRQRNIVYKIFFFQYARKKQKHRYCM